MIVNVIILVAMLGLGYKTVKGFQYIKANEEMVNKSKYGTVYRLDLIVNVVLIILMGVVTVPVLFGVEDSLLGVLFALVGVFFIFAEESIRRQL